MTITDNYSITQLFYKKELKIIIDNKQIININIPTLGNYLDSPELNVFLRLISAEPSELKRLIGLVVSNKFQFVEALFFKLAKYSEFIELKKIFANQLKYIFNNLLEINYDEQKFIIKNKNESITITSEIWDYIVYLLQLTYGKKVVLPPTFTNEEERKFYEAQKAAEEKINKIRNNSTNIDDDIIIKQLLSISYAFPSLNFDYLFNQTMAQIQWLYKYAMESVSYEVNAQACAAGNMAKNKKLDFFIK